MGFKNNKEACSFVASHEVSVVTNLFEPRMSLIVVATVITSTTTYFKKERLKNGLNAFGLYYLLSRIM